ncbi:MAG: diguanylate cyclase [Desulfosporosinus sp.]|nr:diguanylate cyclase [Desulfosporosinus sp.]
MIFIGIGIALFVWFLDSILSSQVFHDGTFFQNLLFLPGIHMHVLAHRVILVSIIIISSIFVHLAFKKQKQTKIKLRLSEQRSNSVFDHSDIGMSMIDLDGKQFRVNRKLCDILGYSEVEMLTMSYKDTTYPEDLGKETLLMKSLLSGQIDSCHVEKRSLHKEGRIVWNYVTLSLIRDDKKDPSYLIAQIQDITRRKGAEEELLLAKVQAEKARDMAETLARTDYLTGLLNRRSFMERLEEEFQRSIRHGRDFALIMADIDKFKSINDTYGHQAGDTTLQEFADCLQTQSREYDFIGRYGGEEFVICLPDTKKEQAAAIAERIRFAVEDRKVLIELNQINITASFGVVTLRTHSDNLDSLILRADQLMYKSKAEKGNNVHID